MVAKGSAARGRDRRQRAARRLTALAVVLIAAAAPGAASPAPAAAPLTLPRTEVRTLRSAANGVDYRLYVSLPPSYTGGTKRYPVVVLLDADYSFALARNIAQHLSDRGDLTELILVGVAYDGPDRYRLHRTRDYTPTFVADGGYGPEYQKVSGGAPRFRDFLAGELLPLVDRSYRTLPGARALVGHSYGGLFGSFVLFTRPELFDRYLLVSPSLWYDRYLVLRLEREFRSRNAGLPVRLYLAVGDREHNASRSMVRDLDGFAAQITAHRYGGLVLRHQTLDDETHNSVFPRALSNGLRFLFEGR
ncbi:MAG: alpha/beta hydrolase [Thermoanaerobaculia bacterium]